MYTASLPPATIWGTWLENIEIWSADDDQLADLSAVTEIKLLLIDPYTRLQEMQLTLTGGSITIPSPGVIQWRVEAGQMGTLETKLYHVVILIEVDPDVIPLSLGPVSIVE